MLVLFLLLVFHIFMKLKLNILKYARNIVETATKQRSKITHPTQYSSVGTEMG